jgi:hypothetical protein
VTACRGCESKRAVMSVTIWGAVCWKCPVCGFSWLDEAFAEIGTEGL